MKLSQLINSKKALEALLKGSLPINIAWELKKFIKGINPELTSYDEIRNQKIVELGEPEIVDGKPTGTTKLKEEIKLYSLRH
jgi:hypothetical protein